MKERINESNIRLCDNITFLNYNKSAIFRIIQSRSPLSPAWADQIEVRFVLSESRSQNNVRTADSSLLLLQTFAFPVHYLEGTNSVQRTNPEP